jgi:hypothetical protein
MNVSEKIHTKYGELKGELLLIKLERPTGGLGLSLAGNRDRDKLSVFVVGIRDDSPLLHASRPIRVGDELLEVSGVEVIQRWAPGGIQGVQNVPRSAWVETDAASKTANATSVETSVVLCEVSKVSQ